MAPDVQCQCLSMILDRLPKQRKASNGDWLFVEMNLHGFLLVEGFFVVIR